MPDLLTVLAVTDPGPLEPPGLGGPISDMLGWLKWIALAAAVGGLIVAGIMMAVGRRNRNQWAAEGAISLPWVVGGLFTIASAATIVTSLAG